MVRTAFAGLAAAFAVAGAAHAAATPDISGFWQLDYSPWLAAHPPMGFHGPMKDPVLTPWAQEEMAKAAAARAKGYVRNIANMKCLPPGLPNMMQYRPPLLIMQSAPRIAVITEDSSQPRVIYLNEKAHPQDLDPSWNGHSIGRWDGATLVIDTVGFNDRGSLSFFDRVPRSEQAHIVERITLADGGKTLRDEFTITDPKSLLEPWVYTISFKREAADTERLEAVCEVDLDALAAVDLKAAAEVDVEARRMLDPELKYNAGGR